MVTNPEADLGRLRRLRRLAIAVRMVARIGAVLIVAVGTVTMLSCASWLGAGRVVPSGEQVKGAVATAGTFAVAWLSWQLAGWIEHKRRELAAHDGVDRNRVQVL